jgi:hypothetical protein
MPYLKPFAGRLLGLFKDSEEDPMDVVILDVRPLIWHHLRRV